MRSITEFLLLFLLASTAQGQLCESIHNAIASAGANGPAADAQGILQRLSPQDLPCLTKELIQSAKNQSRKILILRSMANLDFVGDSAPSTDAVQSVAHLLTTQSCPDNSSALIDDCDTLSTRGAAALTLSNWGSSAFSAIDDILRGIDSIDDKGDGWKVRAMLATAIGNIADALPPNDRRRAVSALIRALDSPNGNVRENVSGALRALAKSSVQQSELVVLSTKFRESLEGSRAKDSVATNLAVVLGHVGPGSLSASPLDATMAATSAQIVGDLSKALRSHPKQRALTRAAIEALGNFGAAAIDAKAAITPLVENDVYVDVAKDALARIRSDEIVQRLELIGARWLPLCLLILVAIAGTIIYLIRQKPEWIIAANEMLDKVTLPAIIKDVHLEFPLAAMLGIRALSSTERVLDAWTIRHVIGARHLLSSYKAHRLVGQFPDIPIVTPRVDVIDTTVDLQDTELTPGLLRHLFRTTRFGSRSYLWITGGAGVGKTRVALMLADLAIQEKIEDRLLPHIALPVILDQSISIVVSKTTESKIKHDSPKEDALLQWISGQLERLTNKVLPSNFVKALLRKGRVILIVDRWSQLSTETQRLLDPASKGFSAAMLVVAAREPPAGLPSTRISLRLLDPKTLPHFLSAMIKSMEKSQLDSTRLYGECDAFCKIVASEPVTPMLITMYAHSLAQDHRIPIDDSQFIQARSIVDLAVRFVYALIPDQSIGSTLRQQIERDARRLASECVEKEFRASAISLRDALQAVGSSTGDDCIALLRDKMGLIETINQGSMVRFVLSPVAVWLAAKEKVESILTVPLERENFLTRLSTLKASKDRARAHDFIRAMHGYAESKEESTIRNDLIKSLASWLDGTDLTP